MLDELGGREIMRAIAFFKDFKNFKQLSPLRKLRMAAIPAVPLALFAGAPVMMKAQSGALIEELRITPVQQTMMNTCIQSHAAVNVEFGDIVSTPKGCACVSKLVSSVTPPAHYGAYQAVQDLAISQYYWSYASEKQSEIDAEFDSRVANKITELAATQDLNQKGLRHMFDYVLSADQICDTRESYQGDSLTSLAALLPLETPIWEGDSEGVIEISLRGAEQPIRVSMNN
jgi:hypothetical protein